MDWGSASPGAVVWGAALPDGRVHIFDEFKFQRMTVKDVAAGIVAKSKSWGLKLPTTTYADPSLKPWVTDRGGMGESIGQTFARYGVPMIYPSNDRMAGWQRVHEALSPSPDGTPWMTIHPRCKYLIRTLPLMVQAKNNPEDLDTDSDDHACDALRYLLMGGLRPSAPHAQSAKVEPMSLAWYRQKFSGRATGVLA